jgi:hypothetical protein
MYQVFIKSNEPENFPDLRKKFNLYQKLNGDDSILLEYHLENKVDRSKNKAKQKKRIPNKNFKN